VVRRPLAVKNAYGATTGDSTDHCAQHVATAFNGEAVRRGRFHINQQEFGKLFSGGRLFRVFKIISLDRRNTPRHPVSALPRPSPRPDSQRSQADDQWRRVARLAKDARAQVWTSISSGNRGDSLVRFAKRDRHGFYGEFKFSEVNRSTVRIYQELIDKLHESEAHLAACVVDGDVHNPFKGQPAWRARAEVAAQLLTGCINRRELVSVFLDGISTPKDCSFEDTVRNLVNKRFRSTAVVAAACLDSRTNDTLQVTDMFAGAVSFERRRQAKGIGSPHSDKAKVAHRLGIVFDCLGFPDGRSECVNIATYRGRGIVPLASASSRKLAGWLILSRVRLYALGARPEPQAPQLRTRS
jgi:hypothetical protein